MEGKTLAEKLAENGQGVGRPDAAPDVVDARALSAGDGASPAESANIDGELDTDSIVRQAKSMREIEETLQAKIKTCLIVDDSRVMRKVASKIAVDLGYQVIEAENGEEALERCKQQMPDLILTDWQMPVMSGTDFVVALRAIPTRKAPTVVFCTSMGTAKDVHDGIRAGADDYIIKPFEEASLKEKLEKLGVGEVWPGNDPATSAIVPKAPAGAKKSRPSGYQVSLPNRAPSPRIFPCPRPNLR